MASIQNFLNAFRFHFLCALIIAYLSHPVATDDIKISHEQAQDFVKRANSPWWFANVPRNGTVAYGNSSYVLFRNVKDFGAVGTISSSDLQ